MAFCPETLREENTGHTPFSRWDGFFKPRTLLEHTTLPQDREHTVLPTTKPHTSFAISVTPLPFTSVF